MTPSRGSATQLDLERDLCVECGKAITQPSTGRRRRTCSDRCRQADSRKRRRGARTSVSQNNPGRRRPPPFRDTEDLAEAAAAGSLDWMLGRRFRVKDEPKHGTGWAAGYAGVVDMVSPAKSGSRNGIDQARLRVDPPGLPYSCGGGHQETIWQRIEDLDPE